MAMVFSLNSPDGTYDSTFLKNYATNYMMDAIKAIKGVGSVQEFGLIMLCAFGWIQRRCKILVLPFLK